MASTVYKGTGVITSADFKTIQWVGKDKAGNALNTVKELDATMTEAAVVTKFDVSDMWGKLPEYSEKA